MGNINLRYIPHGIFSILTFRTLTKDSLGLLSLAVQR